MSYQLVSQKGKYRFLVDGKPELLLAGEIHNSAASSIEFMNSNVWPFVTDIGLNTLLIPIYWEQIESVPNTFNFDLIDAHLQSAQKNQMKIIFLWFGLWKNGLSTYVPSWVKKDTQKYRRVLTKEKEQLNSISPFCAEAIEADCHALAAVCAYIEGHPLKDQLCMIQLQNEVGSLGTARDYSQDALAQYNEELPVEMKELYPDAENWADLSDEAFMAYGYSRALQKMALTAKRFLPLPLFTNAWVQKENKSAGEYPSGGPTKNVLRVWQKMAPDLAALAPDVYEENYQQILDDYQRVDQPLLIPETRKDVKYMANSLFAFAKNALLYSPFGIEDLKKSDSEVLDEEYEFLKQLGLDKAAFDPTGTLPYLKQCYQLINDLQPLLVDDSITLTPFKKENTSGFEYRDEDYVLKIKYLNKDADKQQLNAAGFLFKKGDFYYVVGCNIAIFHEASNPVLHSELLTLEEGRFKDDEWQTERVLNGDERYLPYIGNFPKIIRFSLYTYPKKMA